MQIDFWTSEYKFQVCVDDTKNTQAKKHVRRLLYLSFKTENKRNILSSLFYENQRSGTNQSRHEFNKGIQSFKAALICTSNSVAQCAECCVFNLVLNERHKAYKVRAVHMGSFFLFVGSKFLKNKKLSVLFTPAHSHHTQECKFTSMRSLSHQLRTVFGSVSGCSNKLQLIELRVYIVHANRPSTSVELVCINSTRLQERGFLAVRKTFLTVFQPQHSFLHEEKVISSLISRINVYV